MGGFFVSIHQMMEAHIGIILMENIAGKKGGG
jgi:hypothetical protein